MGGNRLKLLNLIICTRSSGAAVTFLYISVKILYTVNIVGQIFLLNTFLGNRSKWYGLQVRFSKFTFIGHFSIFCELSSISRIFKCYELSFVTTEILFFFSLSSPSFQTKEPRQKIIEDGKPKLFLVQQKIFSLSQKNNILFPNWDP